MINLLMFVSLSRATGIAAILRFPLEFDADADPDNLDDDDLELSQVQKLLKRMHFYSDIGISATCRCMRCCFHDVI